MSMFVLIYSYKDVNFFIISCLHLFCYCICNLLLLTINWVRRL